MNNSLLPHVATDLTEINKLGRKKYYEDRGDYRNPYSPGSPEFNEFERGWMQSLKKNDAYLVKYRKHPNSRDTNIDVNVDVDVQAQRYRSLKGWSFIIMKGISSMVTNTTTYKFILSELGTNWAIECHAQDDQKAFVNRDSVMYLQLTEGTSEAIASEIVCLLEANVKNAVFSG